MAWEISKEFAFSASHQLVGLPDGHPCARLHGHNYVVRVVVAADALDVTGFVVDYGAFAPVKRWIDTHLDHQHLNEQLPGFNPTAENLAAVLGSVVRDLVDLPAGVGIAVAVSETPKTWATWSE
jgi:6-pyruvoyltetrahydropterin/6-carboxytetrahydropterin synthase